MTFRKIDECIDLINDMDKPLAIYYFGKRLFNPTIDRLRNETSSGAFLVNEVMFHIVNSNVPFGGVGASGYGKYHGQDGFKAFSNNRAIFMKPTMNTYPYNTLSPPFSPGKDKLFAMLFKIPGTQNQVKAFLKFLLFVLLIVAVCFLFQKELYHGLGVAVGAQPGECPFAKMARQAGMKNPHTGAHPGA